MGGGHGHDDHHLHEIKIPDYRIYDDWRRIPEFVKHEQRLARLGLKDPWIRNIVHTYDPKTGGYVRNKWAHFKTVSSYGWKGGLGFAAAVILMEESYTYFYYGYTSWNKPAH